jgi:lipoic acid synthetase
MKPKIKAPAFETIKKTLNIIDRYGINTVCYSSKCPNIAECFERGTATFMILGNICTRNCRFCNIKSAKPQNVDINEPLKISKAVKDLNLKYVVITSVDRDDLNDYGSIHFVNTINAIKTLSPAVKIECLTPDFQGDINALNRLAVSDAYKLAHNIETVERLHKKLKPKSSYNLSLRILEYYSKFKITKSSLIVGFGESFKEIEKTMKDLINAGVKQLTIGQYLQPSRKHYPVKKYYTDKEFEELKNLALNLGFKAVVSGKLIRSSYYADKL